jgi:hypothetical protein
MQQIDSIAMYLRRFAHQLEDRILKQFPPLHQPENPLPPELRRLRRTPYPAQALAIAGLAKRLETERCAARSRSAGPERRSYHWG